MLICPSDLTWCSRPECRAGFCELTAERPFIHCTACGVLVVRVVANGFCIECFVDEAVDHRRGG